MFPSALHRLPPGIVGAALIAAALAMPLAAAAQGGSTGTSTTSPTPTLVTTDRPPQFWFGVAVENIPPSFAKQMKLKPDQGVMVVAVFANSPAAKAGLRPDDLLVEINGRPLTSQEDLASAANTPNQVQIGATKSPPPLMKQGVVVYLRDGDRHSVTLTPELRPADLYVDGANTGRFTPNSPSDPHLPAARNIILSNGNSVFYGPGYQFDAGSQQNLTLLQNAVGKGSAIVITQETDDTGGTKWSIREGDKTYAVVAGKLDQVPDKFRPLAEQLVQRNKSATPPASQNASAPATDKPLTMDDRLKQQGDAIQELKKQNEELQRKIDLLLNNMQPRAQPLDGTVNPAPVGNVQPKN